MPTNIKPVSDLRRKTRELLDDIQTEEAVYITQHGRPVAVLVDYARYEELRTQIQAAASQKPAPAKVTESVMHYATHTPNLPRETGKGMDTVTYQQTKQEIEGLLSTLPLKNLAMVQRFVEFLWQQIQQEPTIGVNAGDERSRHLYPTVPLPASALEGLIGLMPPVGGDALADTEALYDEV